MMLLLAGAIIACGGGGVNFPSSIASAVYSRPALPYREISLASLDGGVLLLSVLPV